MNELDLFTEALHRTDPTDRAAFLDRACAGNPEQRRRIEDLLDWYAKSSPIDRPIVLSEASSEAADRATAPETGIYLPDGGTETLDRIDPLATTDLGSGALLPRTDATGESRADRAETIDHVDANITTAVAKDAPQPSPRGTVAEGIGTVIAGRYTLVDVIGEGGMGSVYLASQSEPVKRQVALKLIKTGMDSRGVLARFDAERQALAMMDHPNIARIYDGGVTPAGQPFFVMELVQGVPLTQYCDRKRLPVKARLELFVSVCLAVQHAHQKGIIHRDLKPGNVLVTEVDGRPTPKVIDFGVAKATEVKLTEMSFSDVGAIVGTPTYMSPEQADPTSMDIDTRTDVYALGVMLYELLTGSPPLDASQFKRGAILEMLRMVREVDPPRPSTRLSTAEALPSIAANRSIEPARLSKLLRGELDWVVMKALEKDRNRRYDTANGFARDIQRYLADEVVEARPPGRGYRLRKFVKRNKIQVIAASLVFLALVGGIIGTSIGQYQANRARVAADRAREAESDQRKIAVEEKKKAQASEAVAQVQRSRAEKREVQAIDAVKRFHDVVARNPELKNNRSLDALRKTLLKEPLAFFGSLRASLQADADTNPESLARLANAAHDYSHITEEIGNREDSLKGHAESLAIWERLTRDYPGHEGSRYGLAEVNFCQGKLQSETGRIDEARKSYDAAVAGFETLARNHPDEPAIRSQLALSHVRRGTLFGEEGKPTEAMKRYRSAAAIVEDLIRADPANREEQTNLAGIYMNIGGLQKNMGQPEEALKSFEKALPIWRKQAQDAPEDIESQGLFGTILGQLGLLRMDTGQFDEARKSFESALAIWRKLTAANPTVIDFQNRLAGTSMSLARLQDPPTALKSQEEAAEIWRKLIEANPTVLEFRENLAGVLTNMSAVQHNTARAMNRGGDKAGALALYEKARSNAEAAVRADDTNMQSHELLSYHNWAIGILLQNTGKPAEALEPCERALAIRKKLVDRNPSDLGSLKILADYHNGIGSLKGSLHKDAEAMASYDQCRLAGERLVRGDPESPDFACSLSGALSNMAEIDINAGRFEEARTRLLRAVALQKKALAIAPTHPTCLRYMEIHLDTLVKAAKALGRDAEAAEAQRSLDELKSRKLQESAPREE